MHDLPEADWQVLRELKPRLIERLCERILAHVRARCDLDGRAAHECFLEVLSDAQDGNLTVGYLFDDLRRSNAIQRIARMKEERLFEGKEFSRFSEPTRKRVEAYGDVLLRSKFVPRG